MGLWGDIKALLDEGYIYVILAAIGAVLVCVVFCGVRRCRKRRAMGLPGNENSCNSYGSGSRRSYVAELVPIGELRRARARDTSAAEHVAARARDTSPTGSTSLRATGSDDHSDTGSEGTSTNSFLSCQEIPDTELGGGTQSWSSMHSGSGRRWALGERRDDPRRPATFPAASPPRRKRPRRNKNLVDKYRWLEPLLESIVRGQAGSMGAVADETSERCVPLFVLAGTCPSAFPPAPMQAALFCVRASGLSDFWWVKPKPSRGELEYNTVSRHASGAFKNAPSEKSRGAFEFLLRRFMKGAVCSQGTFTYGVDAAERAFIDEVTPAGMRRRMVLYLIWVEQYSTLKKTLEGKMCFERPALGHHDGPHVPQLRSRQFSVEGAELRLGPYEDEEVMPSMMPGEGFQEMY